MLAGPPQPRSRPRSPWWPPRRARGPGTPLGYILTGDQSDAGSAGIFSRRTNETQEAHPARCRVAPRPGNTASPQSPAPSAWLNSPSRWVNSPSRWVNSPSSTSPDG
eukprot:1195668-Prorocentrum_minimum.AAC.4